MLLLAATLMFWASAPASAADTITAEVGCCAFEPGPYFQDLGEIPTFDNPPMANPHNVTSTVSGPDGDALFRSRTIGAADSTPVKGTQYLEAGTYPFFCTLHGASMSGDLVVAGRQGRGGTEAVDQGFDPAPAIEEGPQDEEAESQGQGIDSESGHPNRCQARQEADRILFESQPRGRRCPCPEAQADRQGSQGDIEGEQGRRLGYRLR